MPETRVAGRRRQEWGVWPGLLLPTKTRQCLGTMTVELRNVSGVIDLGRTGCAVCKMPTDCTKMNLVRPSQSHYKRSSSADEIQVFVPRRRNSSVRPSQTKFKCSSLADKGQVFVPRRQRSSVRSSQTKVKCSFLADKAQVFVLR